MVDAIYFWGIVSSVVSLVIGQLNAFKEHQRVYQRLQQIKDMICNTKLSHQELSVRDHVVDVAKKITIRQVREDQQSKFYYFSSYYFSSSQSVQLDFAKDTSHVVRDTSFIFAQPCIILFDSGVCSFIHRRFFDCQLGLYCDIDISSPTFTLSFLSPCSNGRSPILK